MAGVSYLSQAVVMKDSTWHWELLGGRLFYKGKKPVGLFLIEAH